MNGTTVKAGLGGLSRAVRTAFAASLFIIGCGDDTTTPPPPVPAEGVFAPLGEIIPTATAEQRAQFERGREVALMRFTPDEGLGPEFNVSFCAACHERPTIGGSAPRYRNFLLVGQSLPDGSFTATGKQGVQVQYNTDGSRVPDDENTNVTATRASIPFFGVGLIAEISSAEIEKRADPDDRDGDGISGRVNFDRGFAGRFGRKAQTVSLEGFVRGPIFNHLGVTTNPLSEQKKAALPVPSNSTGAVRAGLTVGTSAHGQAAAPDEPNEDEDGVPDPEMSEDDLFDLIAFVMLLAAPQADALDETTERGKEIFGELGCEGCHVPQLLGPRGLLPIYSDLLIHDMGEELADDIVMKEASGSEFKTQPLWGVTATGPFLHDGRADTIDEAIRPHGGEAQASKEAYEALSETDRQAVIAFIESLGGKSQTSRGLLPPNAPVVAVGEYGGPARALNPAEEEQFIRGREIFDADFRMDAGLGPRFNGDSCRACHFDPIIGGSGPSGVDVTRHGLIDGNGSFTDPSIGTMAHKLATASTDRPPIDPAANVFEHRQTPPIFGLGLAQRIPDAEIMALEDPTDADGDGIFGVARVLPDGRVGKLGWKAGVPDLAEFARDAMFNEIGVTVPADPSSPFGDSTDADGTADPEISSDEIADLVFYMEMLAPPQRGEIDGATETAGRAVFSDVLCDRCHIPELPDDNANPVPIFSDLLLHDVAETGATGIADGPASIRMFRTSPLWGIGQTAPYMHDGRASTIEQAIERHFSEADAARTAYSMLDATERAQLLAFLQSL